jgi:hypothetical protein
MVATDHFPSRPAIAARLVRHGRRRFAAGARPQRSSQEGAGRPTCFKIGVITDLDEGCAGFYF